MASHRGHVNCDRRCDIPEGKVLSDVPASRHAWSDILRCPNEGCGRTFLVTDDAKGKGRLTIFVDGGYTVFRFKSDTVPEKGGMIRSPRGEMFLITEVDLDEAKDVATVKALGTGAR